MGLPLNYTCECGRKAVFRDTHEYEIKCKGCGAVIHEGKPRTAYVRRLQTSPINPWEIIHDRYGSYLAGSGTWIRGNEQAWYHSEWLPQIPSGSCGCVNHWAELTAEHPIDFGSAQSAFDCLWMLHNEVSRRRSGRPVVEYADAVSRWVQQPDLGVTACTSLAPGNVERQSECLRSWKRFGLRIAVTLPLCEIEDMRHDKYPMVDEWHVSRGADPPTIRECLAVGAEHMLLINSDIEIRGSQAEFKQALDAGIVGVRWNYDRSWWKSTREQWGIDAFSFTREQASSVPDVPFRIGRPWWDYWLAEFTRNDWRRWLLEPLFFHKSHDTRWSDSHWQEGAKLFADQFGEYFDRGSVRTFRDRFPK